MNLIIGNDEFGNGNDELMNNKMNMGIGSVITLTINLQRTTSRARS